MIAADQFRLLGQTVDLGSVGGWQAPQLSYLLRYNLHYFDDLNAAGCGQRRDRHAPLIERWVAENPPAAGVGWEPYPTSLRMVNWVKWALAGNELPNTAVHSLAIQARQMRRRMEHHLLGNHLFSNAKALVHAGCYFDGPEARSWRTTGLAVIARELNEQILTDGGQFERSPMYHALAFEDLLDLLNLARVFPSCIQPAVAKAWAEVASRMWRWLRVMCHPDGEVSHFNDSVRGVAPAPRELDAYAQRLGLAEPAPLQSVEHLPESGYIRLQCGEAVLLIDVAAIGPDYLPGHAHADTLSFELSMGKERVLVNSGIDRYGVDAERLRQRGTAAHNTVSVNGLDSSEVWSGFRVARRARPEALSVTQDGEAVSVECAHGGYRRLPGRVTHHRRWRLSHEGLEVRDRLEGDFAGAQAHYHLAPAVEAGPNDGLMIGPQRVARWEVSGGQADWVQSRYHPQFGLALPSRQLTVAIDSQSRSATLHLRWP